MGSGGRAASVPQNRFPPIEDTQRLPDGPAACNRTLHHAAFPATLPRRIGLDRRAPTLGSRSQRRAEACPEERGEGTPRQRGSLPKPPTVLRDTIAGRETLAGSR